MVTKNGSRNKNTKCTEAVGKAYLLTEISREKKEKPLFAILFKYRHPLSFKLRSQIATTTFQIYPLLSKVLLLVLSENQDQTGLCNTVAPTVQTCYSISEIEII